VPTETERDLETVRLLNYGFSLYRKRVPVHAHKDLANPSIRYAGGELPLRAERSVAVGVRRGERMKLTVQAPDEVEGPIDRGTVLGRALVFVDGIQVTSVPLRAGRTIPAAGAFDRVRSLLTTGVAPIALTLSVILIGAVLLGRNLPRSRKRE
jgi:D-alanyl-D-alanine carboxypeptidase